MVYWFLSLEKAKQRELFKEESNGLTPQLDLEGHRQQPIANPSRSRLLTLGESANTRKGSV